MNCQSLTKKRNQCKNRATYGNYCYIHSKDIENSVQIKTKLLRGNQTPQPPQEIKILLDNIVYDEYFPNKEFVLDYFNKCYIEIDKLAQEAKKSIERKCDFNSRLIQSFILKNNIKSERYIKALCIFEGKVWEILCLHVNGVKKNKNGLDLEDDIRKTIIEVKNRYNTDNSSSRANKFQQLRNACYQKLKEKNEYYTAIYGICNPKDKSEEYYKDYNGFKIKYLSGDKFFSFVFGNNYNLIIQLAITISNYILSRYLDTLIAIA